jgi:hypothetical protein
MGEWDRFERRQVSEGGKWLEVGVFYKNDRPTGSKVFRVMPRRSEALDRINNYSRA